MDWNENKSVRLSQACVVLFAVCLLLLDCLCYFAVRWFTGCAVCRGKRES